MPLGDSITQGCCVSSFELNNSYRNTLYDLLADNNYSVDFVGGEQAGTFEDIDHEGHDGWRADEIRDHIFDWLVAHPADIILLHIGTNDISQNESPSQIVTEVEQILDEIDEYSTGVYVVLARIINRESGSPETTTYNQLLQELADERIDSGDLIVVVDQESALNYTDDIDGRHPTAIGYTKMAQTWYPGVSQLLNDLSLPVEISSFRAEPMSEKVQLYWTTESELNIVGYSIERRLLNEKEYARIASYANDSDLRGNGNTSNQTFYKYYDHTIESGVEYIYKLTAFHFDGSVADSREAACTTLVLHSDNSMRLISMPNPFNSFTRLIFQTTIDSNININIFDSNGRLVKILYQGYLSAGDHDILFNGYGLAAGLYYAQLLTESGKSQIKIMLVK